MSSLAHPNRPGLLAGVYLALTLSVLAWSAFGPSDRGTWIMETVPVMIGVPLLIATRKRAPLTPLLYLLLCVHGVILMVGGRYTYAEVPIGFWVQDLFELSRNHYDRLGHLAQGFVPAILAREVLRRCTPLRGRTLRGRTLREKALRGEGPCGSWLGFLAGACVLAFSAFYELIEWWAAVALGSSADAFLGTQGDVWDTQWDMFMALCGAVLALTFLSRLHEGQLQSRGLGEQ